MSNATAIAIGGFDGMHLGHQELFSKLGESGSIVVIETGYANLTPKKERENFTDYPFLYLDLETIRHLDGRGFIDFLQNKFPKLEKIVVGYDFHFGKDRKYSYDNLKILFSEEVVVVDEVKHKEDSIHSNIIRTKLTNGDIKGANAFLGYNYTLKGEHISGQGIGAKELVATINIEVSEFLVPKEGVYATLTRINSDEHFHPSVSFIGHRQTTDGSFAIETHILGEKVLCVQKVAISFVSFIRENRKFETLGELKEEITKDIEKVSKELQFLEL